MAKELRTLLVILFIFMIIAVIFQAVAFMTEGGEIKQIILEQFTLQPTRASDCRCLPGYIPSNKITKRVLGKENQLIEIKNPITVRYGSNNRWVEKDVSSTFRATNSFFGSDPAPGVVKQVEIKEQNTNMFFCQSLSNPSNTKQCY
jgi:hypothetical protein